ncbi:MAG: hypothetical protein NTZ32_02270 [Planctomycetales bacterium]|nr:hypothetical protein [Planctomycetales bacterium]
MVSRLLCRYLMAVACLAAWSFVPNVCAQPRDLATELGDARRIFVPAEDLDVVVERDKRGAMLTKGKFEELLALAKSNAEQAPPANVPLVLTNSEYAARVVGDQLLLSITAEVTQFASDWQTVSFAMQRLSIEKALLDDEAAMIGRNADGSVSLLSDKPGKHTLKLELSTELNSLGSDQVAAFSLLRAPSGSLTLTLPAGKRLFVGALQLERPAPLEQAADYKVAIGGAPGIQLRITDRAAENAADALTFATTGYGLHVAPGEVTWHALTTLQVFGKPVDRLTFSVPSSLEIADIDATGLESWDLTDGEKPAGADKPATTNIVLTFGQAFDGSRKISFKGVMSVETGKPWAVPPLTIANVTSHIGQVLVQHPAGVRLRVEETNGVRRATQGSKPTADMPDEMSKLNATEFLRFDAWQPDFLLRLTTQPKQREVQAAVAAVLDVNATGLDLQSAVTVETHFASLFELDLEVAADWTILSATRDDKPLKWQMLPQDAGVNQLRILLDPPIAAESSGTVKLSLRRDVPGWPVDAEPVTVDLPELFLPQSSLTEGALVVRGDDDLDLAALDLSGLDAIPLKADYERLRFQSQDTRYGGQLKVTRKPSRLSAQTMVFGRVDPQTTHTFVQAVVEVEGGGVRTLKVALPEAAGTALRFQAVGTQIVEQKPAASQNGERVWTLQFDRRVRGQILLTCDIELPRAVGSEPKAAAAFAVPQPRFVDAERQNGFLAVEAGGEQRLTILAKGSDDADLAEVDPLELPAVYYSPKERIVAVYRNVAAGASLTLSEERFDKLAVPTAVCQRLDVMTVVGRTGELQHRATFQLTAVGVQGLRVTLPKDVSLWATLVDGEPVEVRRHGDIYLVPFARLEKWTRLTGNAMYDAKRELKLFYRSSTPALTQFGSIEQAPPELSVQTGQGTAQPLDVLDQHWTVHYPPETRLVSSTGPLEPEQKLDETSLLGQLNAGFQVPTLVKLGWQVFAVVVTLGVIALCLLIYQRGSQTLGGGHVGLGTVLGVLAICAVLFALLLPATQQARESSRRVQARNEAKQRQIQEMDQAESAGMATGIADSASTSIPAAPMTMSRAGTGMPAPTSEPLPEATKKEMAAFAVEDEAGRLMKERLKGLKDNVVIELREPDRPQFAEPNVESEVNVKLKNDLSEDFGVTFKDIRRRGQPADPLMAQNDPNRVPAKRPGDKQWDADRDGDGLNDGIQQGLNQQAWSKDKLALLSLAIDLAAPSGSLEKSFRYVGADPARGGIGLNLGYVDETSGTNLRVFLMALVALVGWFLRKTSCANKIALAALGLTIPLALLPLAPQSLQVVLDGVFFGVLIVCGLWLAVGIAKCLESCCVGGCCGLWTGGRRQKAGGREEKQEDTLVSPTVAGLMLFALLAMDSAAFAQKGEAKQVVAQPAPPVSLQTSLIVPFDAGTDPLAADKILLPFDKFVELYRLAYPDKSFGKGTAPQAGGVVEALYSAKVIANEKTPDESSIDVTARFAVRSFVDGQLLVELPLGKVAARDAKLDGKTAALIASGDCLKVAVSTPGLHVVDFAFSTPARLSGSTGTFTLPLLAVPSGKLSFALPAKDLSVRINGSTTIFRRVTTGDAQSIDLPIDKGGDIAIAWQPEQAKGAAAAVVHVDSVQAITLTDAGTAVSNGYQYRVRQGSIADVSFALPESLKLQAVNGPDVGGWELQGEGAARKLRVIFRRNVTDTTKLTVEVFLDVKVGAQPTTIEVPPLAPQEVTNEIGQVAVFAGEQFSLRAEKVEVLAQIDGDKFTTQVPVSRPNVAPQLAYRFSKRPFALSLRATRQESQANVTAHQAAFVTRRKQLLTTRLLYNLTGAPRSSLNLSLPAGFVVLDVNATGLHDWSTATADGRTSLTIDLSSPRLGLTEVVLGGSVAREGDTAAAALSFPQPLDATKLNTTAAVWLDEGFSATLDQFEGWRPIDAALISNDLKAVRANKPVQFAFATNIAAPSEISLKLTQATPKLSANGLTMTTVTDVAVIHTLALQWQIDAATADALVFTTPSSLAGKLVFTGGGIRETTHVDAGNGRTRWTIWLRTPVSGKYFVTAVGTLPPATTEVEAPAVVMERSTGGSPVMAGQAAAGEPPAVTGDAIDGQRQYVLLINASQSQLTTADTSLTEAVQREDVPVVVDQSLIDQATELVKVKKLLTAPKWSLQKFAQTQSAPASVNVADLTTVVSRDGTYRGQAVYTIKNRSRQFLAFKLPPQSELLSVFVGNQPSRAVTTKRKDGEIQLVALPKTSAASLSFPVRVIWRGKLSGALPKSARVLREEFSFPAPEVISQQADPEFGIPVARTRWTVYLPDDLDAQPITTASRHNLTLHPEGLPDLIYQEAALQEISFLCATVEQNPNGRTNYFALGNLKQLGTVVRSFSGASNPEFDQQKVQVLKRLDELQQKVQVDEGRQSAVVINKRSGKGVDEMVSGSDVSGTQINVNGNGIDSFEALAQNRDNNKQLILSNTLSGKSSSSLWSDGSSLNFNFGLQNQELGEQKSDAKDGGKPSEGKPSDSKPVAGKSATKGSNVEQRQNLRSSNDANLGDLNTVISNNGFARQQGQGQQGQQGVQYQQALGDRSGRASGQQGQQGGFGGGGFAGPQGGGQQGQQGGGLWMNNPGNALHGNSAFIPGMSGNGVIINNNSSGVQSFTNGTLFDSNASFGVNGVTDGTVRFANPGPMVNGPGSGAMQGDANAPQGQVQSFDFAFSDMPVANGGIDNMFGANVNGLIAQPAQGNLGGVGMGQMPNGGGSGSPAWTQAGGLSLGFELPLTGQKLVFTKAGGDPKLALGLRPQESVRFGLNLAWTLVWLAVGVVVALAAISGAATTGLARRAPLVVAVIGVLGFFLLPSPLSLLSFLAFVGASVAVAWINRNSANAGL